MHIEHVAQNLDMGNTDKVDKMQAIYHNFTFQNLLQQLFVHMYTIYVGEFNLSKFYSSNVC